MNDSKCTDPKFKCLYLRCPLCMPFTVYFLPIEHFYFQIVNLHLYPWNPFEVRFDNCTSPLDDESEHQSSGIDDGYYDESYDHSEDYDSEAYDDLFARFEGHSEEQSSESRG